jgi:hypothetical protein
MIPNNRNKKGTGFTNLSRILQASKGARLGGQVASGVQKVGQQVRGQIGQASEQFEKKAGEEAAKFGEEAVKERESAISSLVPTSSGSSGVNAPQADQSEAIRNITNWRSSEYKGPTQLEDYESLASRATEAEQLGRLGRTSGGKQELLRRFVGGKDYSQGEQRLDTALLGLTGQSGLSEARRLTRGLGTELAQKSGVASEQARQLAQQASDFSKDTAQSLIDKKKSVLSGAEYGVGGKSLRDIFTEAESKESGRAKLSDDIRDFNTYFQKLVASGAKTKDQQRDAFYELLDKAKNEGYISQGELSNLFDTKSINAGDAYNPEYDFISRAQKYNIDPYASLSALVTSGKAAENLNLADVVAAESPERARQLKLIEQLAGDQAPEFADQGEFKKGTLGFEKGTPLFKQQVLDKEIKDYEKGLADVSSNIASRENKLSSEILSYIGGNTRTQLMNMLRSRNPNAEAAILKAVKNTIFDTGATRRLVRSIVDLYPTKDKLSTDLGKASTFKNKIDQELASIDNPYATTPEETE